METACYYTFSTVCQTLAGAFGFLVAVVIYRIQGINSKLNSKLHSTVGGWGFETQSVYVKARDEHDWPSIGRILREANFSPTWNPEIRQEMGVKREEFLALVDNIQSIKKRLRTSLWATGLTIGLSLVVLPWTPLINRWSTLACILLGLDVVAAAVCLVTYFVLAKGAAE